MLARAARRKLPRDASRSQAQLSAQLTLPWLCPAQLRWATSIGSVTTTSVPDPRSRTSSATRWKTSSQKSSRHENRSLATAADVRPAHYESVPFAGLMQAWGSRVPSPESSKLQPWDTSKPLIIHDASSTSPSTPMKYGIGGNPTELHQNLYACLRVGRIDRAKAIIKRLTDMYTPLAPELVDAHNVFLQTMFELAAQEPSRNSMAEIEEWFEKEMIHKAIIPNGQTFVTLLRSSMTFLQYGERVESIRKYLAMAHEEGGSVLDDVNTSPDFSEKEWDTILSFQNGKFVEPPPVEQTQFSQLSTLEGQELAIRHGLLADPALDVKSIEQKGMGLSTLKSALKSLRASEGVQYPHELPGTEEEKDRAYAYMRQVRLEQDSTAASVERWKSEDAKLQELGIHGVLKSKSVQALMWNWYSALVPLLKKELQTVKEVLGNPCASNSRDERHIYGPYLEQCPVEKLAALTVSKVVSSSAGRGEREDAHIMKLTVLALAIGREMENEVNASLKNRSANFLRKQRSRARNELLNKLSKGGTRPAKAQPPNTPPQQHKDNATKTEFPSPIKAKIGALALEHLLQSAMITVSRDDPKTGQPLTTTQRAFQHHSGFSQGKRTGWIAPHQEILEKLRTEPVHGISDVALPMLSEPKPWAAFSDGGYFTVPTMAIRTKLGDSSQKQYATAAIDNGDMQKMLSGLDVLGKVPWNINSDVFRIMVEAWNTGEGLAGLVPENDTLERPTDLPADASFDQRVKWGKKMKEYNDVKGGLHSQRCFHNFQLEIARSYLNETFYYPHSVDFRGRAYPVPPILNHIGADISRGLLRFANGKELGVVGLQWLKVHLANLAGYDKASLRDREQFAMDHLNEIYDSATNPLGGNRWWATAEDPWQCLACCIELKNALDSPDPTRFVSHLPVHQDGTCNGLQHYAALGGDYAGASQVNLEPSDRPQDIYTGVAELVKQMVGEDAAKGDHYAKFLDGKITRRVVKRTVMTNVYGVTFMGAKTQVLDELKTVFPDFEETDKIKSLSVCAMYVAKKIFLALGKIFNGAQEIQYWLGECGERITTSISAEQVAKIQERFNGKEAALDPKYKRAKSMGSRVKKSLAASMDTFKTGIIWTTPLKMPVVQPYRKHSTQKVKTNLQEITLAKMSTTDAVDKRKQLQAFPPNFIHSLDATHMILSALKCSEVGLSFAAVHDSFWTHAADIPTLNVILRDAFVRMHSEDIIGRLAAEFRARYAGAMYRASLHTTSNVANKIRRWRSSHRNVKKATALADAPLDEVALEKQRQDLLNSENEEDRKRGEEMVTPTSIWLAEQDPDALSSYRLALLGETKRNGGERLAEAKKKVLGAEAEAANSDDAALIASREFEADEPEASIDEDTEANAQLKAEGDAETGAPASGRGRRPNHGTIRVWLPLSFPPVPQKGGWDVQRLRESKYFFS